MSANQPSVNAGPSPIAPLQNVRLAIELVERMKNRAPHLPGLAVLYGPSGYGKTQSTVAAANRYNAAYIECGQSWNASTLVDAIYHELTGSLMKGSVAKKVAAIIEVLAEETRPLFIDEADFLVKRSMIDLVREMSDRSGASVILIGEELMPAKLRAFERACNRVLYWQPAEPCDFDDAMKLAKLYVPHLTIEEPLMRQIVEVTYGVTRRVVTNLERMREFSLERGISVIGVKQWGDTSIDSGMPRPRLRKPGRAA
jgi:DNA transposition AAA+ family ATPase